MFETNTLAILLHSADPENIKSVRIAKNLIKGGWIGEMSGFNGDLIRRIEDPKYVPVIGQELSLFDGQFSSTARYTVAGDERFPYLDKH